MTSTGSPLAGETAHQRQAHLAASLNRYIEEVETVLAAFRFALEETISLLFDWQLRDLKPELD